MLLLLWRIYHAGNNIVLQAKLTPYRAEDGSLILVAQGQIWIKESTLDNAVRYLSTFKSIPINFGETIFFFPLGLSKEISESKAFNIELAIQIVPFKNDGPEE